MAFGQGIFANKKTYIVAVLAAVTAVAGYLTGTIDLPNMVEAIFVAVGAITMRAGIEKSGAPK